jgi:glycosyltransferase involved in cell wall biosynthesis
VINKRLSRVVVPTGTGKSIVPTAIGIPDERIVVIPPGFDPAAYEAGPEVRSRVRASLELGDEQVVVGTVGWIEREKGQYELLEASRNVLRSHSSMRLVVAGHPGSPEGENLLDFMRGRVRKYHMEEVVRFVPFPERREELLSAFDVFVMPSLEENFSRPLAEAMLSGLACIGTEAGGTPEVLENGKAGLLVPSGSADGIARALMTLFENPELCGILGARARKSARARFDIERIMKQVENLYSGP